MTTQRRTPAEVEEWRFRLATGNWHTSTLRKCLADPMPVTRDEIINENNCEFRMLMRDELERREKARNDV